MFNSTGKTKMHLDCVQQELLSKILSTYGRINNFIITIFNRSRQFEFRILYKLHLTFNVIFKKRKEGRIGNGGRKERREERKKGGRKACKISIL